MGWLLARVASRTTAYFEEDGRLTACKVRRSLQVTHSLVERSVPSPLAARRISPPPKLRRSRTGSDAGYDRAGLCEEDVIQMDSGIIFHQKPPIFDFLHLQ